MTSRVYPKRTRSSSPARRLAIADVDLAVDEYKRARHELGLIGAILPINAFLSEAHRPLAWPRFLLRPRTSAGISLSIPAAARMKSRLPLKRLPFPSPSPIMP